MSEYLDRAVCLSILRAKANMAVSMGAAPYFEKAAQMLEKLPAADVAPVVHGHWIICSDGYYPYCSVCKCEPKGREMTKFCGECGAKMDEENS